MQTDDGNMDMAVGKWLLILVIVIVGSLFFWMFSPMQTGPDIPWPVPTPVPTTEPMATPTMVPPSGGTSHLVPVIVAAGDSSAASQAEAAYICDGVHDEEEINRALRTLPPNGKVVLSEGTFTCQGTLLPQPDGVVCGNGVAETTIVFTDNGRIQVDSESVILEDFTVTGSGYDSSAQWYGVINIQAGHVSVRNVTGTCDSTIHAVFNVLSDDAGAYHKQIEDIEFINCSAVDCGGFGFINNAWGTIYKQIRNVRYTNCRAINCGKESRFNPWVTGFDFAELNDIDGLQVTGCCAEGCWESGFHFEWDPEKTNCVFTNCVSKNNGQKPYPPNWDEQYFGSGYYVPKADVTFYNCVSEGNSKYGFYFGNGGSPKLYGCTDMNCGAGRTDHYVIKPASYYVSGRRSGDQSFVMEDCSSIDSGGYGIFVARTEKVYLSNFVLQNPAGIEGIGASFGDNSWLGSLVDAEIDLYASGNRAPYMILVYDNQNTRFTGKIISDVTRPVTVDGSQTRNVAIADMEIISNTLPEGSTGITVTDSVPAGAVRMTEAV